MRSLRRHKITRMPNEKAKWCECYAVTVLYISSIKAAVEFLCVKPLSVKVVRTIFAALMMHKYLLEKNHFNINFNPHWPAPLRSLPVLAELLVNLVLANICLCNDNPVEVILVFLLCSVFLCLYILPDCTMQVRGYWATVSHGVLVFPSFFCYSFRLLMEGWPGWVGLVTDYIPR